MPRVFEVPRPFLKWAGGKSQLVESLRLKVPEHYNNYFEPFVGAGALYYALKPKRAVLSDINSRLVKTWLGVRDHLDELMALLRSYPNDPDFFAEQRARDIDSASTVQIAAWMIYLNKTGFNGLYRVNSKNRFNVPFGRYPKPAICDERNLRAASALLADTEILHAPFTHVEERAVAGDFVYFDPPYVPLSTSSSFTSYTQDGFRLEDQRALRDLALRLKAKGVAVLLSNSSADVVSELYAEGFERAKLSAARSINSVGAGRGDIFELIMW